MGAATSDLETLLHALRWPPGACATYSPPSPTAPPLRPPRALPEAFCSLPSAPSPSEGAVSPAACLPAVHLRADTLRSLACLLLGACKQSLPPPSNELLPSPRDSSGLTNGATLDPFLSLTPLVLDSSQFHYGGAGHLPPAVLLWSQLCLNSALLQFYTCHPRSSQT